jgi:hypothetical protein
MNRREFTRNFALAAGALGLQPLTRVAAAQDNNQNTGTTVTAPKNAAGASFASGVVYGEREGRSFPLPKVRVSNGSEIVTTDRMGRYRLPVSEGDIIFVIKPRDYALPVNDLNLPQFYRIHQPQGSPKQEFPGIAPTGPLPTQVNFSLKYQKESDEFRVLLFGDPQSRNQEEVGFMMRDVISDVAGQKAAFGISLGDIAFNDLSIYENHNKAVAMLDMPWFNLLGNHDLNFDAPDRTHSIETYKSLYGPAYYSFDFGSAHFVVLDDVAYDGDPKDGKRGTYHTELGAKQLKWLENDLKLVPTSQLVVLMMHIPLVNPEGDSMGQNKGDLVDLKEFFRVIEKHPHCLSISAHTHFQEHMFLGKEVGFNGAGEHHHFNHATVCGSWWGGLEDEYGIPHTTMRDGAPNGYSFLNIKGNQYTVDFKAARRSADYQMNIYVPLEVASADAGKTEVLANVFAGSQKSKVEMQVGSGRWIPMQLTPRQDPAYLACKTDQDKLPKTAGRKLPEIIDSPHMWVANLPSNLPKGGHLIQVRTTDMWGRTHEERQIMRVV